jgi:hypothetical protein
VKCGNASTSPPASVLGERFCLLSAGLLPGVRSPDRLYWFKRIVAFQRGGDRLV